MDRRLLIVDDLEENRLILEEILKDTYEIATAKDGLEAVSALVVATEKPALVLSDIMMPGMDGFDLLKFMKKDEVLRNIPVIFITAATDEEEKGLDAGAIDFISKPFNSEIVRLRVNNQIELSLYRARLEEMVEEKAGELISTKETFLETLASMIEYRSLESGEHIKRTKDLTAILIEQLLKGSKYAEDLKRMNPNAIIKAAALHDIGKIGIPDNILLKPGRLTPEEFDIIKSHSSIGGDMIKTMMTDKHDDYIQHCYSIARHHHEKWDGSGYPDHLKGEEIPLPARIVALVDVYDALVSERCYKKSMTHEEAMTILAKDAGTHFDTVVVEAMLAVQDKVRQSA
jgi:putative two-component system response regulator